MLGFQCVISVRQGQGKKIWLSLFSVPQFNCSLGGHTVYVTLAEEGKTTQLWLFLSTATVRRISKADSKSDWRGGGITPINQCSRNVKCTRGSTSYKAPMCWHESVAAGLSGINPVHLITTYWITAVQVYCKYLDTSCWFDHSKGAIMFFFFYL